jgi:hypothetical protein
MFALLISREGKDGLRVFPLFVLPGENFTENAVSPLLLRARAQLGWIPNV